MSTQPAQPVHAQPAEYSGGTLFGQPAAAAPTFDGGNAGRYQGASATAPRAASPMLVGLGAAVGIVALLAILYLYVLPHRSEAGSTKAETTAEKTTDGANAPARAHPLAKHLEVSGVRVQESAGGKVRIEFNVINHSSAELPDLKLEVRLRSGGRDYFVIPVSLPSLGPFASKELSTSVRTDLKPYELPDWQRVEAQFSVQDADSK